MLGLLNKCSIYSACFKNCPMKRLQLCWSWIELINSYIARWMLALLYYVISVSVYLPSVSIFIQRKHSDCIKLSEANLFCDIFLLHDDARPITKKFGLGRSFFRNVVFVACMKDISPCISKYFENFSKFLISQSCQIHVCFNNKSMASARKIHLREESFG